MTLSLTTSIHADQPLYQQIIKAVEVFTNAKFEGTHTVEFQHKGSTLTLTWNSLDNNLLVEGQVSKYTSLAKGNVLKLNPTKGRIRVDRASFGMWEAIDNNWLGCKTLVAARKIAEDWATRANAQATLSPLES